MKAGVTLMVVVMAAAGPVGGLLACGEKYLVPGRSPYISRTPAERGAVGLLVLASPDTALARALGRQPVEASLRKAGYAPRRVDRLADLDPILPARRWDVLVADLTEAARARDRVRTVSPSILVVPIGEKPSNVQLAQARREFPIVVKTLGRPQDVLEALDAALSFVGDRR